MELIVTTAILYAMKKRKILSWNETIIPSTQHEKVLLLQVF